MRTIILIGPRGLQLRTSVPQTRRERIRGLLGRNELAADEALLLERTRSVHTFGMRFAIGVAQLDTHWIVRAVVRMPPRRVLMPRRGTRHVVELSHVADVRPGDRFVTSG